MHDGIFFLIPTCLLVLPDNGPAEVVDTPCSDLALAVTEIRKFNELFESDNTSATQSQLVGCTQGHIGPAQPGDHHKICFNP
eukprot:768109-Hanusia_phi.AAC.12